MKTKMPDLRAGATYCMEDVRPYVDNYDVMLSHRNDYSGVVGWQYYGKRDGEIVLEYQEVSIQTLAPSIQALHDLFAKHPEHMNRVMEIKNVLLAGDVAWPLLIKKGYKSALCPDCKIHEGMHRAVAHQIISSEHLPLFVMRYLDDTDGELF